jgi:hypothetical protein
MLNLDYLNYKNIIELECERKIIVKKLLELTTIFRLIWPPPFPETN